jgi:tRNA G18 (ribose-2'-O)-methylase SpoU
MAFIEIREVSDPRLAVYRDLNRVNLTRSSGRFVVESRWLVQRLLASSLTTESILCSERLRDELEYLASSELPVYVVPPELTNQIVGFNFHRGMLACGLRPSNATLGELVGPPSLPRWIVVCPQIVDPTNLAGVIRNCAAFGVDGLLLGPHCADVYSRRVTRVSMGTVFQLPVRIADDLQAELHALSDPWGFHRVATVLDPRATPLPLAQRLPRLALFFGSEGHGLEERWLMLSDQRVTLAMQRNTDSLNVATATGVFLYHYAQIAQLKVANRIPPGEPA